MAEFKHIRTSILPFGYNPDTESFRFSLCIDLNPNYSKEEADSVKLLTDLRNFVMKYGSGKDSIFTALISGIQGNIKTGVPGPNEVITPFKASQLCFQQVIIENVPGVWKSPVFTSFTSMSTPGKGPAYVEPLNILASNSEPILRKFPDVMSIRGLGIKWFTLLKKNNFGVTGELVADADISTPEKEIMMSLKDLGPSIQQMSDKLDGILSFAEGNNHAQSNYGINGSAVKHQSIYDSAESLLDIWSFIDSNIVLQRLMGKTIDFEIKASEFAGLSDFRIELSFSKEQETAVSKICQLKWEHLPTASYHNAVNKMVLVQEAEPIKKILANLLLSATNYDVGGKLISLKAIQDKYGNYEMQLKDPSISESEKYQIRKRLIALDTAALTIGINIYNAALSALMKAEAEIETSAATATATATDHTNYLYRLKKGYRVAVRSNFSASLTPIGKRNVNYKLANKTQELPEYFQSQHATISTDAGTHSLLPDNDGNLRNKVILDPVMGNWSGENIGMPSVFSSQEHDENFEATTQDGSTSDSIKFVSAEFSKFFGEDYKIKGYYYDMAPTSQQKAPFNIDPSPSTTHVCLEYSMDKVENKKLVFGRDYQIVLTPELKNGWAVPFKELEILEKDPVYYLTVKDFTFKRNEPVHPVDFRLQQPLLNADGKPVFLRQGESLTHLAIRNHNVMAATTQTTTRHILPPAISFKQAFWHHKIFEMPTTESRKWYIKSHFAKEQGEPKRDENGETIPGAFYDKKTDLEEMMRGSTMMRDFYPGNCEVNYLPDPLTAGFRLEFYKDKNKTIKATEYEPFEQVECYFTGDYPNIRGWKLIVQQLNPPGKLVFTNKKEQIIVIEVEKADELYISIRTILADGYEKQFETFGNYNEFTKYGNNDLLTPPLEFSITHATQRPLVTPSFNNVLFTKKELGKTFLKFKVTCAMENTGIYYNEENIVKYIEGQLPTGSLELYAKWEDYQDHPDHITTDDWTPEQPVNNVDLTKFSHNAQDGESPAVYQASLDMVTQLDNMEKTLNKVDNQKNDFKNYAMDLDFQYDVKETKFIEKYFWLKNKSKFTSYYPANWGVIDENTRNPGEVIKLVDENLSREIFNTISRSPFVLKVLNSKKPNAPELADRNINLISVTDDMYKGQTFYRKSSLNRLRFFFKRNRLSSGKGERIGFVVNEPNSPYNDYLVKNNLVSIVGRDIVSDIVKPYDGLTRNTDVLLTKANFNITDPYDIAGSPVGANPKNDLEDFQPKYVADLGIMTYLPKFSKEHNLWYLDVELDINDDKGHELHSPFLRFSMVHYQENSFHPVKPVVDELSQDCRISEINKSGYVYILPSRHFTLEFGTTVTRNTRLGFVKAIIDFDVTSLKKGEPDNNTSKFYLIIRYKSTGNAKWVVANKTATGNEQAFFKLPAKPGATSEELSFKLYTGDIDYQVVFLETEDWGNDSDESYFGLFENRKSRVIHVSTFEIKNNMI